MHPNRKILNLSAAPLRICIFLLIGIVMGIQCGCTVKSKRAKDYHQSSDEKRMTAELPEIGEIVTTDRAIKLCEFYGFSHLVQRIKDKPSLYKEWEFDGCSMTPDEVLSEIINVQSITEICLRHDLGYAYGSPGNKEERLIVDEAFRNELLSAGAREFVAKVMFDAVRLGGKEELCLPFTWSFAREGVCKTGVGFILNK